MVPTEEAGAENDHLRGQLRLVAKHVKQQKQDAAALQAELSELRMNYTCVSLPLPCPSPPIPISLTPPSPH